MRQRAGHFVPALPSPSLAAKARRDAGSIRRRVGTVSALRAGCLAGGWKIPARVAMSTLAG
jgi:hypothetical protein